MRCSPSTRMSATVKGATAEAEGVSWAKLTRAGVVDSAEARAMASRRRGRCRVIITSGSVSRGAAAAGRGIGAGLGCGRALAEGTTSAHQVVDDVVVERQAHQGGNQGQADVLADRHRALAHRAALDQLDKVIQQVTAVQDGDRKQVEDAKAEREQR